MSLEIGKLIGVLFFFFKKLPPSVLSLGSHFVWSFYFLNSICYASGVYVVFSAIHFWYFMLIFDKEC